MTHKAMGFPRRPGDRGRLPGFWTEEPIVVDGYRPGGVPWPIETSRHTYLAPIGGFSMDVPTAAIGVNRQALAENTALEPGDLITVSVFERGRPVPLMVRPTFEVVPLDFETPEAFLHAVDGQVVLSHDVPPAELLGVDRLHTELRVILNGVLACQGRSPVS